MKRLKERVEKRESDLLTRYGFDDPAGFFKQFQWLNGIVVWKREETEVNASTRLWANPQARRPLPSAVVSLLAA